jgi:hypothetical protein
MAIATVRRKTIKVGERRSALIELPNVSSYEIETKWDPTDLDESLLKRGVTDLSVKGFTVTDELDGLNSLPLENFAVKTRAFTSLSFYEISGRFRHCEETVDGYEFFNEDDTV